MPPNIILLSVRINPKSGVLYVERPLDAEMKSAYSLTVTALDHANTGMRKQSSAKVRIYIVDVNDNDPQFKVRTLNIGTKFLPI